MTDKTKWALKWWREERDLYVKMYGLNEAAKLADAFAELHPPDDEPLTVEQARELARSIDWLAVSEEVTDEGEETGAVVAWTIGGETVFRNPTRNQIRRLIAALEE